MDFEYTDEQKLLRASADRFLDDVYAWERRSRHVRGGGDARAEMMSHFREMGWSGLCVDELNGGIGGGVIEAVILMESLGRQLSVEPFLEAFIVSARLIARCEDPALRARLLTDLVASETFVPAWHEDGQYFSATALKAKAVSTNGKTLVDGSKIAVAGGDVATHFIIPAILDNGDPALCLIEANAAGVQVRNYSSVDDAGMADLHFSRAPATIMLSGAAAVAAIDEALDWARIGAAAEALGGIQGALDLTAKYLKTRRQFGQPLGKFQALQHRMADLYFEAERARTLLYRALQAVTKQGVAQAAWICAAKLSACEAYKRATADGIQLHGAMGMTEEYPIGHYYRRALVLEKAFGDSEHLYQIIEQDGQFQLG